MNLQEITNQESGIVVLEDVVFVINWASFHDFEMPFLSPINTLLPLEVEEDKFVVESSEHIDNILDALPGEFSYSFDEDTNEAVFDNPTLDLAWDEDGDLIYLLKIEVERGATPIEVDDPHGEATSGTVYYLSGATLIAPDGWN